jgi:hypothetical protein
MTVAFADPVRSVGTIAPAFSGEQEIQTVMSPPSQSGFGGRDADAG